MAEEFIHGRYYESSKKKWIDIHSSCKSSLEYFLSKLLFKDDLSRVVYATTDIAFRKRIESQDMGKNEDGVIKSESLNLPFASYCQVGDFEPDDRPAAVNAGQAVEGLYYPDIDRNMRSLAVKGKYKATIYFSRHDDVRLASQILLWEKEPSFPYRAYTVVEWRNTFLDIPTFITIDSINSNPSYQESDWLTKNRIFVIDVEFTIRTYELLINNIDKVAQLPLRFGNWKDIYEEDEDQVEYLTEEVVLEWASRKWNINIDEKDIVRDDPEYQWIMSKYFKQKTLTEGEILRSCAKVPNKYTTDIIQAYWSGETTCVLNAYMYDEVKSTPNRAHIVFKIKPSTFKYFKNMTLQIATKEPVTVEDCHQTEAYIDGLYPNSEYTVNIFLYAIDDTVQYYKLRFKTKNSEDNEAPQPEKINFINGLVGMHI